MQDQSGGVAIINITLGIDWSKVEPRESDNPEFEKER